MYFCIIIGFHRDLPSILGGGSAHKQKRNPTIRRASLLTRYLNGFIYNQTGMCVLCVDVTSLRQTCRRQRQAVRRLHN